MYVLKIIWSTRIASGHQPSGYHKMYRVLTIIFSLRMGTLVNFNNENTLIYSIRIRIITKQVFIQKYFFLYSIYNMLKIVGIVFYCDYYKYLAFIDATNRFFQADDFYVYDIRTKFIENA